MSTSSQSSPAMSKQTSQAACLDPLDALVDFSEYDQLSYNSPSLSPSTSKTQFPKTQSQFTTTPISNTPAALPSSTSSTSSGSQSTLPGPSHQYDLYRQQTGIPQGAVASTLAVNSSSGHNKNQFGFSDSYFAGLNSGLSPTDDLLDFNTAPTRNGSASFNPSDMDMDFDSPVTEPAFFYPDRPEHEFIDPSAIGASGNGIPAQQSSNVGRLWPGMHQQQALAKAQAQQKQQQQLIQQQRPAEISRQSSKQPSQRPRQSHPPTDPIVEEKISQLLNSMRHSSVATDDNDGRTPDGSGMSHAQRMRKDEEEMDEDERLLASEEGKKLSSKERRQLRNKVSARAFRSRRKEYISQLEGEIAVKVNENQDLRSENRALMEENTRLSDLTRMLLSSSAFSGFLDTLAQNPAAAQTAQQVTQPRVEQQQQQQQQPQRQMRKDVNPYAAQQQMQQQQIGMAVIPENNVDFSMLDLNTDGGYSFQPQVFSVFSMPETIIDSDVLSGKDSSYTALPSVDEKVELPKVERAPEAEVTEVADQAVEVEDAEFDSDPTFALFISSPEPTTVSAPSTEEKEFVFDFSSLDLSSKPSQYELVVTPANDDVADAAMRRIERLASEMDVVAERLRHMTVGL